MNITITKTTHPGTLPPSDQLGFGTVFTDHMFLMDYSADKGWHDARVVPYGPITMSPAASVLHYGTEVFEGMKAYRRPDGGVQLFRSTRTGSRAIPARPSTSVRSCTALTRRLPCTACMRPRLLSSSPPPAATSKTAYSPFPSWSRPRTSARCAAARARPSAAATMARPTARATAPSKRASLKSCGSTAWSASTSKKAAA